METCICQFYICQEQNCIASCKKIALPWMKKDDYSCDNDGCDNDNSEMTLIMVNKILTVIAKMAILC